MAERPRAPGALVVAVDGVLADTLPGRLAALLAAARAVELIGPELTPPNDVLAGRSWSEAVRLLPGVPPDETLLDLAAHAAEREWTEVMSAGLPVVDTVALARCRAAVAAGWRLILRADSTRRSSGSLFSLLEEETGAVRTITGDDPGVLSVRGMPIVSSQYAGIIMASSGRSGGAFVETDPVRLRLEAAVAKYLSAGWPAT
jgi:hypothetical protein